MEKYDVVLNTKGVRKVAFAAGFGLIMGKEVANAVSTVVWTMFGKSLVREVKKLVAEADEIKKPTQSMTHYKPENSKECVKFHK